MAQVSYILFYILRVCTSNNRKIRDFAIERFVKLEGQARLKTSALPSVPPLYGEYARASDVSIVQDKYLQF